MTIAAPQEQQGGQDTGKAAVAVLEWVDGQKMDDKRADHQQRMQLSFPQGRIRSADQLRHQSRGVERGRRLENNADAPAVGIERLYIVGKRLIFSPVAVSFVLYFRVMPWSCLI